MSSACAPHIKKTKKTCYTDRLLRKLAESHNQLHPDDPISTRQSSSRIHNQIMNRYRSECGSNEACWLKLEFGRKIRDDELHKLRFALNIAVVLFWLLKTSKTLVDTQKNS